MHEKRLISPVHPSYRFQFMTFTLTEVKRNVVLNVFVITWFLIQGETGRPGHPGTLGRKGEPGRDGDGGSDGPKGRPGDPGRNALPGAEGWQLLRLLSLLCIIFLHLG